GQRHRSFAHAIRLSARVGEDGEGDLARLPVAHRDDVALLGPARAVGQRDVVDGRRVDVLSGIAGVLARADQRCARHVEPRRGIALALDAGRMLVAVHLARARVLDQAVEISRRAAVGQVVQRLRIAVGLVHALAGGDGSLAALAVPGAVRRVFVAGGLLAEIAAAERTALPADAVLGIAAITRVIAGGGAVGIDAEHSAEEEMLHRAAGDGADLVRVPAVAEGDDLHRAAAARRPDLLRALLLGALLLGRLLL